MLLLDILLILMISICIIYCWILNRRIEELQNSRIEFARTIKELNFSIDKAASSVGELERLAHDTEKNLKNASDETAGLLQELCIVNDIASGFINKLDSKIHSAKSVEGAKAVKSEPLQSEDRTKFKLESNNMDKTLTTERVEIKFEEVLNEVPKGKFTDDDFSEPLELSIPKERDLVEDRFGKQDTVNVLKFLNSESVGRMKSEEKVNLDQMNYYKSLRRVVKR